MSREEAIQKLLSRNVVDAIDRAHLERRLLAGEKLRVKLGIDPTGEKIHIGYAVALWKMREFQDLGHKAILIIGDFTAQIGDASDKTSQRPMLSKKDIDKNLKNYLPQFGKIIDLKKAEVRYNGEWLNKLNLREMDELADLFTVRQMIERKNFQERWDKREPISLRELHYPLYQGYDSVAVRADVELGGSDQLFNLLAGRKIQEHYGQKPQDVLTTELLIGLDGRKMSKSWGNVINVDDSPDEQFGRIMSLSDAHIMKYFELATDVGEDEIAKTKRDLAKGRNPKEVKEELAMALVGRYHGEAAALGAREKFESLFSKKEAPENLPELKLPRGATALDAVLASGAMKSKSEARRLIAQGGFEIGGHAIKNPAETLNLRGGEVLRAGKKRFFRVKI